MSSIYLVGLQIGDNIKNIMNLCELPHRHNGSNVFSSQPLYALIASDAVSQDTRFVIYMYYVRTAECLSKTGSKQTHQSVWIW